MKKVYLVALFLLFQGTVLSQTIVSPFGSVWKYLDNGSDQGTAWIQAGFDDSSWSSGAGQLGFGDGDETTLLNICGIPPCIGANRFIGYYFRQTINIPDVNIFRSFIFDMYRDDGVVIYVNGIEVYRNNMPAGPIAYNNLATSTVDGIQETTLVSASLLLAGSQFVSGNNTIAVEVHQSTTTSSDLSWDMRLTGVRADFPIITRGPYLQKATSTSVLVRWYTDLLVDSKVRYGTDPGNLSQSVVAAGTTTSHSVQLTGLTPYTKYYYSIETTTDVVQSGLDNYFLTSPLPNAQDKYTFWAIGDMGNNSTRQRNVLEQFNTYMGNGATNGWILLGDNAYDNGTDAVYTTNFFEIYQNSIMKKSPVWPSTGNHEYANSTSRQIDHIVPYFDIFDPPTNGEGGGVPSNSEAYYSFDYGNIHFIALDTYIIENSSYRLYDTLSSPQVQWLKQDLAANTKKWTIAYFHHPPYTMGSHNSDTETELIKIRENIVRILERNRVDLVLTGHSHAYERSKLMKGHFGLEATFDPAVHDVNQSSGKYDGTINSCTYIKDSPVSLGGTVYAVVGSSGKLDPVQVGFPHNAMYYGNDTNGGGMIVEIQENRLDAKWLTDQGTILDQFTIMKNINKVNNVNLVSGASVTMQASWVGQYNWNPSGQTSRSLTLTPQASSTYTVTDPSQCISDTYTINVSVTINISSIGITQACVGNDVSVVFTTVGSFYTGNVFTLQLSDATGNFTSPINIGTLSSTASGTINGTIPAATSIGNNYGLRITSSYPQGISSASVSFAVNALPALPTVSNISYCQNATASALTATPLSGHTLQWYGTNATGGTASTTSPTPSTNTAGTTTYYVSQKNNTTGCEGLRVGIVVTIKSTPKPTITATGLGTGNIILNSSASSNNQWFKDGVAITGATSQTFSVLDNGVYQVQATLDGCLSELSAAITVVITDVVDPEQPIRLNLFPVPAHQAVNIQLAGVKDDEVSEVLVFDKSGRLVDKRKMRGRETTLAIDEYLTGDYFLRIINKSFLIHSRFVKH